MKNFKRALRRHQKNVKHIARLKIWANSIDGLRYKDDDGLEVRIRKPNWKDVKEHWKVSNLLKTISTVCSCPMCACDKYHRAEQKKIDKMFLELEMED